MKEDELSWQEDELDVKERIMQKRRPLANVHEASEECKENQAIWDNGDTSGGLLTKKRNMFTCHICGENFDMVAAIRRHYNTNHPGNKPFACDSCGKRFDRKENLNRHIRIHTGDRRYVCNHCGKGYTDPSGLKKHVLSKHSNLVFPCQFCKATFKSKDSMNRHLQKHLQDYDKAKKDDTSSTTTYDVGSKRLIFDDTSATSGNKVFLQATTTTDMNSIETKDINETNVESEGVSTIQDGQETYSNTAESIEVQFIQLSQNETISLHSDEDKLKNTIQNGGQFSNQSTAHAQSTQFVLPLTADQILKLTTDPKNMPFIADQLKNLPISEEHLKNLPISAEQLKTLQMTEEQLKNIPITAEHFKTITTTDHLKPIPFNGGDEHLKNLPITTEQLKNLPMSEEHLKNLPPMITDQLKSLSVTAEQLKNIPLTDEHLKSLSIATAEQIRNLPMTTEQLKSLPIATEQFIHSNASTGQLITVAVVTPQSFAYTNNDTLTNTLTTYSAASADINLPKEN